MEIQKIIDKFMDGTSTLEEERRLEEYFRKEKNIPEKLEPYREMFAYFTGGMVDDKLLKSETPLTDKVERTGDTANGRRQNAKVVAMRRIFYVAASVAVLFIIAYNIIGRQEESGNTNEICKQYVAHTVTKDSMNTIVDSTLNINGRQDNKEPERHTPRKFRYKPAPPEVLTADASSATIADSIDRSASRMAEAELRKVEYEQQYMLNLIKVANLLNATDIAATADEELY